MSDADEPMFRCADCGAEVTLFRGRWAVEVEPGKYDMTCRTHIAKKPDGTLRLEAAHYHYVAGETQQVFPA